MSYPFVGICPARVSDARYWYQDGADGRESMPRRKEIRFSLIRH